MQLPLRNPAGLCPHVNYGGSGFKARSLNDVEEEEQVAETENPPRHIKHGASQRFRVRRTESFSFEMHAPHQKSSSTTLKPLIGGLLALPS